MMGTIVEAALRSLVAAAAVGAGLHLLRVRNVLAQKAAWGMVLAAALAMPLLLSAVAHWPVARFVVHADPMTLLEELQAHIRTRSTARPAAAPATQAVAGPVAVEPALKPQPAAAPKVEPRESTLEQPGDDADLLAASVLVAPEITAAPAPAPKATSVAPTPHFQLPPPATLALLAYAAIVLVLLGRLLYGLVAALALSRRATPVALADQPDAEGIHLRVSTQVASPVTIGSSIVLPADYVEWDAEKLRIVLAHEGSHIRQGDFYLQLIAGVHAALFWFSPLGWWLRRKLSDLAEAISDRAGLAQAASRAAYAQILLEFAALPRPTQLGVAMARSGKLTRRIERLLNESTFREAYAGTRRRALAAVLLVPAAVFIATSMIRVEAAGHTQEPAPPAAPAAAPA
ncbi:MAG: M56 family metallopeptidase, partial [Terracidiphilus sp.]